MQARTSLALASSLSALLGGCTAISDLDRFESADASGLDAGQADAAATGDAGDAGSDAGVSLGCDNPQTFCLRLTDFTVHENHLVVADLVSEDGNLRARAMVDPAGSGMVDIVMPLAIPESEVPADGQEHPLHIELWGDATDDGEYTPTPSDSPRQDHDWKLSLPASGNRTFKHDTAFSQLLPRPQPIGGDFTMEVTGFGIHDGQLFEAMVIEASSGRTVGLYRLQDVPASGTFSFTIPGIIDLGDGNGGVEYIVEYYADDDDDGTYSGFPADHSWKATVESDANGVTLFRPHSSLPDQGIVIEFQDIDYQFDFAL